jgi:hypothetical protein
MRAYRVTMTRWAANKEGYEFFYIEVQARSEQDAWMKAEKQTRRGLVHGIAEIN